MNFCIAYPVDGGTPEDSHIVLVRTYRGQEHICQGGGRSGLRSNSGAAFIWERVASSFQQKYALEFSPLPLSNPHIKPENLSDCGDSDALACALAVGLRSSQKEEYLDPTKYPLILASCSFQLTNKKQGLRGLKLEAVTDEKNLKSSLRSLQNKWACACNNKAKALILHNDDAYLLADFINVPVFPVSSSSLTQILSKDSPLPVLLSCQKKDMSLVANNLDIDGSIFQDSSSSHSEKFPPEPFRFLSPFTKKEESIFFGREQEIHKLANTLLDRDSASVFLLFGQSGVGKSSFLFAGLIPYLERQLCQVVYFSGQNSFESSLENLPPKKEGFWIKFSSLWNNSSSPEEIKNSWLEKEEELEQPLIVIMDQWEEVLAESSQFSKDWGMFCQTLECIFGDYDTKPQGRLILSFRKEWLSLVENSLSNLRPFPGNFFLRPLSREGIIQIIEGLDKNEELRNHYSFFWEPGLSEIMADGFLTDHESPLAPFLQILLSLMWEESDTQKRKVYFTLDLYHKVIRQGIFAKYVKQHIENLAVDRETAINSGLILDILDFHIFLNRAQERSLEELEKQYSHLPPGLLKDILTTLKNSYLLCDSSPERGKRAQFIRLAHDSLAPIIHEEVKKSHRIGQRSRRILESQIVSWRDNHHDLLSNFDLETIEQGRPAMRALSQEEEELVSSSHKMGGISSLIATVQSNSDNQAKLKALSAMRLYPERHEVIIPAMIKLMEKAHEDDQVKRIAVEIIGEMAKEAGVTIPILVDLVKAGENYLFEAMNALIRMEEISRPALQVLCQSSRESIRLNVVRGFSLVKIEGCLPFLLKMIEKESSGKVKKEAYKALGVTLGFQFHEEKKITSNNVEYCLGHYVHEQTGMEFVFFPSGSFMMGSDERDNLASENERPRHFVSLSPFFISRYLVTQKIWEDVMGNNPSYFKNEHKPVETVTWHDCQEFCQKTKLQLPSEEQWEYACRGGTTSRFYWGPNWDRSKINSASYWAKEDLVTHTQWKEFGFLEKWKELKGETSLVGNFSVNPFGLYDMLGNVWEWCEDNWSPSYEKGKNAPTGNGLERACRGGCAWYAAQDCRCASRVGDSADNCDCYLGFRVVKNI